MIFNLINTIKRTLTATVGSLLAFVMLFHAAFYSIAGNAIAADLNSPSLLTTNAEKMANQVEGQLELAQGKVDKKNTQFGAEPRGTQKIDPDRTSQDIDRVKPTVEATNKNMSNKLNEAEKTGKGAGIKAAEKGSDLLDNVKDFFDKK